MNLSINNIPNYNNYSIKRCSQPSCNQVSFQSKNTKLIRNLGMVFAAASMIYTQGCINKPSSNNVVKVVSKSEKTDTSYTTIGEYYYEDNTKKTYYHYFPTDNAIDSDNFQWSETVYNDGRIEKDSMGYQITITPKGERTVIKEYIDEFGNNSIMKILPDGTKIIRKNYNTNNLTDIHYSETQYWPNGNIQENKIYKEYYTDKNQKHIEQSIEKYNEDCILLMWESNLTNDSLSAENNKYDKKGRLIYDDLKQEIYKYKGSSKHPYCSISEKDNCQRIKMYSSDGNIIKDYFKAKDGTITNIQ